MFKKTTEQPKPHVPYDKTPLQVIDEELVRMHHFMTSHDRSIHVLNMIQKIHEHLFKMSEQHIPARIKSIEDSIADLYLTDTKGDKK